MNLLCPHEQNIVVTGKSRLGLTRVKVMPSIGTEMLDKPKKAPMENRVLEVRSSRSEILIG